MDTTDAIKTLENFTKGDLTATLSRIESSIAGLRVFDSPSFLSEVVAASETLAAASAIKRVAGQINVTIHALGILLSELVPHCWTAWQRS